MIQFVKYEGTGNDFVLIDDRENRKDLSEAEIKLICDRHFGVGADGLIRIRKKNGADFEMLYYNSDGLPGSMCGNGGRCAVSFAHALGIVGEKTIFEAFDGLHDAVILNTKPYRVKLH